MELLEKNIRLFKKMKDLAFEQQASLQADRLDSYFHLSRQRAHLRSQITLNERKAASLLKAGRAGQNPSVRRHVAEMVEVIGAIQDVDARIKEMLTRKKESLASEIGDLKRGRQVARGYGRKSSGPAKFIDKRS